MKARPDASSLAALLVFMSSATATAIATSTPSTSIPVASTTFTRRVVQFLENGIQFGVKAPEQSLVHILLLPLILPEVENGAVHIAVRDLLLLPGFLQGFILCNLQIIEGTFFQVRQFRREVSSTSVHLAFLGWKGALILEHDGGVIHPPHHQSTLFPVLRPCIAHLCMRTRKLAITDNALHIALHCVSHCVPAQAVGAQLE
jgi:hypothetical protein